jgi:hypothetical protein
MVPIWLSLVCGFFGIAKTAPHFAQFLADVAEGHFGVFGDDLGSHFLAK